jgi:hypothetical protein
MICDLPPQPKLKILSFVATIFELAALESISSLIKVHQRNNARTSSTPSKMKNNKHIECHSTQLAGNKTKGKNKQQQSTITLSPSP